MKKILALLPKAWLLTGFFILFVATLTFAQGPGSGGPQPKDEDDTEEPPTGVPIDGGAGLLLAAGAGYGIKVMRSRYKNRETKK